MTDHTIFYPRFYSLVTQSTFLHLEDALDFEDQKGRHKPKLRFFVGRYTKGEGASQTAFHFVDAAPFRVILHDLAASPNDVDFVDFKGTTNGDVISRIMRINANNDAIWFEFSSGKGKATATGAVLPDWGKNPATRISVKLSITDARQLAYDVLEYLQAWRTSSFIHYSDRAYRKFEKANEEKEPVDLDALNEELFGNPGATPDDPPPNTSPHYANGQPVAEDMRGHWDTFYSVMRTAPYDQEKLVSWIDRN